ncbi:MAG: Mini-ribonuclease 3 [Lachnospiraceae bacterium]|jgi:ribonuclease-3 family protein|nr:Mini-ribonuclease 3 [Lachnospiraceae bacterium]
MGILELICQEAAGQQLEIKQIKPLALAYIGDTLYDLYIRSHLVLTKQETPKQMHVEAVHFVKASSQAKMMKLIMEDLTEEETEVFKRGRNQKSLTVPKNTTLVDYKWATGFEALLGYLYVTKQEERLYALMKLATDRFKREKTGGKE